MRTPICRRVLFAALLVTAISSPWANAQNEPKARSAYTDLAITYSTEHAQLAPGTCGCFWLQGGGADAALTLWKGFGIAASVTGGVVSNYAPGVDFSEVSYLGGLRYTYTLRTRAPGVLRRPRLQVFGDGLFGSAHAFSGAFPSGTVTNVTANSFALQTGGGINLFFSKRFAVRLLQVDYARTQLPNGYDNTQNDLRLGFGLAYHTASFRFHK
jgi:outer membrane immunogenic protein